MLAAVGIFSLTYMAVAAGRLPWLSVDRPAAALLMAVARRSPVSRSCWRSTRSG